MRTTEALAAALSSDTISEMRQRAGLPTHYLDDLRLHLTPLATELCRRSLAKSGPLLVGINGCQGSGKSTLAQFLAAMLKIGASLRSAVLSIDDFYLEKSIRSQLAHDVHPLLLARGVPGTHDLDLANRTLDALLDSSRNDAVRLPGFDKATDDRKLRADWSCVSPSPDVIILEGWCIGCPPQSAKDLRVPVNTLERDEDAAGIWRSYVNDQLLNVYQPFFARLDLLIMLAAPDFDSVFGWRQQQEIDFELTLGDASVAARRSTELLSPGALRRFISHFERLTRHQLKMLPALADAVVELARDHRMVAHSGELYA